MKARDLLVAAAAVQFISLAINIFSWYIIALIPICIIAIACLFLALYYKWKHWV